jgi:hypothetical protein
MRLAADLHMGPPLSLSLGPRLVNAQAERSDWGVGFDWERGDFRRGYSLHNDKVRRAPRWTGQIQAGRGGRLMGLGVHAGEWSALPCGSAAPPAERDCPLAKGSNNTHPPTPTPPHTHTHTLVNAVSLHKRPNSLHLQHKVSPYPDALQHLSPLRPVLCHLRHGREKALCGQ